MSPKHHSLAFEEKEQLQEQIYEPKLVLLDKSEFLPETREVKNTTLYIVGKMTVSF